jgi:hypothetical protein
VLSFVPSWVRSVLLSIFPLDKVCAGLGTVFRACF